MGKHPKLVAAPKAFSVLSLVLYLVIWVGAIHVLLSSLTKSGGISPYPLTALMCVVYLGETTLALVFQVSSLANWRRVDYQLHHLPYCLCVGGAMTFGLPIFEYYYWTLPLTLLTSLNEALAAAYSLGAPRSICEWPLRLYLLLLMVVLIGSELTETIRCLMTPGGPGKAMAAFAFSTLPGAAYHSFGVVPTCLKRLAGDKSSAFSD